MHFAFKLVCGTPPQLIIIISQKETQYKFNIHVASLKIETNSSRQAGYVQVWLMNQTY